MADDDSARRQRVLDHPEAERKTEIEPDSLLDNFGREPVAAINGFRCRHHRARRADVRRHFVNLTAPSRLPPVNGPGGAMQLGLGDVAIDRTSSAPTDLTTARRRSRLTICLHAPLICVNSIVPQPPTLFGTCPAPMA
jgi:hypothetical protein